MDDGQRGEGEGSVIRIHMPTNMTTDSAAASVVEDSYSTLKEDVLGFMQKGGSSS